MTISSDIEGEFMSQELQEKLANLGLKIQDDTQVNVEAVEIVVERDRQDVGH
jgi:hypothetical protein